ncbi:hypothetical protein KFL_000220290 [Klebsormidium nitens]|uniref:Plastid lipid-associated protein/fibrillin conserved domain-containing protein n=1 Tax=Klebsormidium nitens TaxID=105231 RepID=A0A1Y1HT37_KLENI|nr:hypothetical protein KFL_000220290 [Klebsormidium nitens]|eukprot:GAQ78998.1 hypothetical protein KFL_000220290 [Klebsormidium nitens]
MASNAALLSASPSLIAGPFTCHSCSNQANTKLHVPLVARARSLSHSLASTSSYPQTTAFGSQQTWIGSGGSSGHRISRLQRSRYGEIRAANGTGVATEAREMERVAAKEAVLLAIRDAGGVEALSSGPGSALGRITVSEKILALERLNPTSRPTTSPQLEGTWEFLWAGARSPGLAAARRLLSQFPSQLASIDSLTLNIFGSKSKAVATIKAFSSLVYKVTIESTILVEGNSRLKEAYEEGSISAPSVDAASAPSQVRPILDQIAGAVAGLPAQIKSLVEGPLTIPLTNTYERLLLITYLDDELLIARDPSGVADVLVRENLVNPDDLGSDSYVGDVYVADGEYVISDS